MYGSSWNRWLKSLGGRPVRRRARSNKSQRLDLTTLETRDVPSAFTAGDLVVLQVGTGTGALGTGATASFLDEYHTTGGALVQPAIPLPTTASGASHALTEPGSTVGEAQIGDTVDGRYLLVTGYDAAVGTASVASTTAAANNRVVGRVDSTGAIDTTTGLTDANSNIRDAASTDGQAIYTAGGFSTTSASTGPVRLTQFGTTGTSTTISTFGTSATGFFDVGVNNNNLFISGSVGALNGVAQVGGGLPTTSGQTTTQLPGFPTTGATPFPASRRFIFSPSGTTLYVADSRTTLNGANFYGGIEVWKFNGTSWGVSGGTNGTNNNSPNYTLAPSSANNEGIADFVADFSGSQPVFYATTVEASGQNKLVMMVDTGAGSTTSTTLETAATNEAFRGVAFAPKAVGATADTNTVTSSAAGNSAPLNTPVTFTATVNGSGVAPTGWITFSYAGAVQAVVPLAPTGNPGEASAQYTATMPIGSDVITATYGGDTVYVTKSTPYTLTVNGTTTTTGVVSNNPTPTANGQSVMFTATVMPASNSFGFPAGTINFLDNGVSLGSVPVSASGNNGTAQLTVTTAALQAAGKLAPGGHVITASYVPGGPFTASSGTVNQTVKANAFGAGDIVTYRVGDGTNALSTSGTATAVWLDEFTTTGTPVQSIVMPSTDSGSSHGLTAAGYTLGDGILSNSADGRYLIATGYDVPLGTANASSTAPATNPRTIALLNQSGTIDSTTALTDNANNIRSATTTDGTVLWDVGSSTGANLRMTTDGTSGTSTAISSTFSGTSATTGLNAASINNNQLFIDGGASNIDGVALGSTTNPLPVTTGQTESLLPGFPTTGTPFPQARQFIFAPSGSTIYVADSRTAVNTSPVGFFGGLQVWQFNGSTWGASGSPNYVISPNGASDNEGLVGIAADFSGPQPVFYATTSEASGQNRVVKIVDGGSAGASTVTPLFTAPANEQFDGVAFAPKALGTANDTNTLTSSAGPSNSAPIGTPVTFTATVNGSGAVPTGWITFKQGTTVVGVAQLSPTGNPGEANAQFTASNLTLGTTTITAVYGGDAAYVNKTGTLPFMVTGTPTTTTVSTNNPTATAANQSITFTATVMPANGSAFPQGTVDFVADGFDLGSFPVTQVGATTNGQAQVTVSTNAIQATSKLTPGIHTITATYMPSGAFLGGAGTAIQNVKANPFGAGDLLVVRIGDGISSVNPTTVNGYAVYIDEVTSAAGQTTPVQSILMPTSSVAGGNQALLMTAQQSQEGQLSLSGDGQYVYLVGYDQNLSTAQSGSAVDLHTSAASAANGIKRTIGRIKYDGTIDTSMALSDLADGGDVHSVVSPDGTQVYAAGSTSGVRYVSAYNSATTTSTQIDDASNGTNGAAAGAALTINDLGIYGGQLYLSDSGNGNAVKVATVGSGLPTTNGQTDTIIPGLPVGTTGFSTTPPGDPDTNAPGYPLGYYFTQLGTGPMTGPDTMYVADDGSNFYNGTITKWSLVSGSWVKVGTIESQTTPGVTNTYSSPVPSFVDLNATVSGGAVKLYASYGNGGNAIPDSPSYLFGVTDTSGYNAAFSSTTVNTVYTSPAREFIRGVAPVPTAVAPAVSGVVVNNGQAQISSVTSIKVTFNTQVTLGSGALHPDPRRPAQRRRRRRRHPSSPATAPSPWRPRSSAASPLRP